VINFRYHVVSLTAVFLALAIGLVMGTAALNNPLSDALKNQVSSLAKQRQGDRDRITQLETEAGKQEQFAQQAAPIMLAGKLTGRRVLVLSMPQTGTAVAGVVRMLGLAGAKVTGQVEIEDKFTDPTRKDNLLDVANSTLSALSTNVTKIPLNSNGAETSSFLLASVLVAHNPVIPDTAVKTVLSAYKEANFIVPTGELSAPADAVVLVAAQPYTDESADARNTAVVTIADQFGKAGPLVVASGGAAGAGNVISAVRGDPALAKTIATVDNVNTPDGQVAVPLALAEFLTSTKPGHYGVGGGASAMLPKQPA
jgi:Copper transport outer membrane protein, MctB